MSKKFTAACAALVLMLSSNLSHSTGVVETYNQMVANDPGTVVSALSDWFASSDSRVGQTVTLYAGGPNGENTHSHLILARFPDYASFERLVDRRANSDAWNALAGTMSVASTATAAGMLIEQANYGSGGSDHKYLLATPITVNDPETFAAAFERYQESATGRQRPGETRLLRARVGGSPNGYIIVETAPTFVALNEYYDLRVSSDDFARFQREAGDSFQPNTTLLYIRIQTWNQ